MTLVIIILLSIICLALDIILIGWKIEAKIEESKLIQQAGQTAVGNAIKESKVGKITSTVKYAVKTTSITIVKWMRVIVGSLRNMLVASLALLMSAVVLVLFLIVSVVGYYTISQNTSEGANNTTNSINSGNSDSKKANNFILVGDSRTCGLYDAVNGGSGDEYNTKDSNGDAYVCKSSMGYDWMLEQESSIDSYVSDGIAVIINMGTNNAGDPDTYGPKYSEWINKKADDWIAKGATVYFMSTNPCDPSKYGSNSYTLTNENIEKFNSKVKEGLDSSKVTYLDSYSQIKSDCETTDGLHYDTDTYKKIYDFIVSNCKKSEENKEDSSEESTTEDSSSEESNEENN